MLNTGEWCVARGDEASANASPLNSAGPSGTALTLDTYLPRPSCPRKAGIRGGGDRACGPGPRLRGGAEESGMGIICLICTTSLFCGSLDAEMKADAEGLDEGKALLPCI
jgi:hypothetical protein